MQTDLNLTSAHANLHELVSMLDIATYSICCVLIHGEVSQCL